MFGGICILFDDVKEAVTTKEAAESYGVSVNRAGMACCIFHNDHTPSMKVDVRFHCFGCGADGDVIDFTARLFDLSPKAAAEKLAADFNIAYDGQTPKQPRPKVSSVTAKRSLMQRLKNDQNGKYRVLCSYLHLLESWQEQFAPKQTDEEWHLLYTEALQNIDRVNYLLDELQGCTANEAQEILSGCKNEIARYAARVREFKPRLSRNKQEPVR